MLSVNTQTLFIISIFSFFYLSFLIRKTARGDLDLYDCIMLSMVSLIPFIFVALPRLGVLLSMWAGVKIPFVIMFSVLFVTLFWVASRLTSKVSKLEKDNLLLMQDISIMRLELASKLDKAKDEA